MLTPFEFPLTFLPSDPWRTEPLPIAQHEKAAVWKMFQCGVSQPVVEAWVQAYWELDIRDARELAYDLRQLFEKENSDDPTDTVSPQSTRGAPVLGGYDC